MEMVNMDFSSDLKLCFCGHQDCTPGHTFGPGSRDCYIFHYISEGCGVFESEGMSYSLSEGDGFLIIPDTVVTYSADKKTPWKYTWIAISGSQAEDLLKKAGLTKDYPILKKRYSGLSDCVKMINSAFTSAAEECRLLSLLYNFLAILIEKNPEENIQHDYISRAEDFMKYNFSSGIRVSDAAKFVGIDTGYLSRLFKEKKGISPVDYLIKLRMEDALRLLGNPHLRIGDIAAGTGYADQFVFSKAFKRFYGLSPAEYRKKSVL